MNGNNNFFCISWTEDMLEKTKCSMKEIKSENQHFKNSIEFMDLTNHHHQWSGKDNHLMWDVHILRVVHE